MGVVISAPYAIAVLTDELTEPGDHVVELHLNLAKPAPRGDFTPAKVAQSLIEYSFGLSKTTQLSVQLPVSRVAGRWYGNGIRGELQYVAPHKDDEGAYWGLRGEIGYDKPVGKASVVGLELLPIVGYRAGRWHFMANPSLNRAINGSNQRTQFDPAAKLAYRAADRHHLGVEYYIDGGRSAISHHDNSAARWAIWCGTV